MEELLKKRLRKLSIQYRLIANSRNRYEKQVFELKKENEQLKSDLEKCTQNLEQHSQQINEHLKDTRD